MFTFVTHGVLSGKCNKKYWKIKIKKLLITDTIDNSKKINKKQQNRGLVYRSINGGSYKEDIKFNFLFLIYLISTCFIFYVELNNLFKI